MNRSWSVVMLFIALGAPTSAAASTPRAVASKLLRQRTQQFGGYRTILARQPLVVTADGKVVFTYQLSRIKAGPGQQPQRLRNAIVVDPRGKEAGRFASVRDLRHLRGQVVVTTQMDAIVLKLPAKASLRALTDGLRLGGTGTTDKSVVLIIEPADPRRTDASFGGRVWLDLAGGQKAEIHVEFIATRPAAGGPGRGSHAR